MTITAAHTPADQSQAKAGLHLDATQRLLIALAVLRVALALLFMLNVFPLERRYGWYLQHGGDQGEFMALASAIIAGEQYVTIVGIGPALVMIPWLLLLEPYSYFELVAPLVVINGFVLGGLSVLVVGGIARRIFQADYAALAAAGLWAVLPLAFYYGFFWHFDAMLVRSANLPKIAWLNGLSDGPAMFFSMLAVLILAGQMQCGKSVPFWPMFGAGAAMGLALSYRIHYTPMIAVLLVYVLVAHGPRALIPLGLGGLLGYLPQAIYNQAIFGFPFTTGYISAHDIWSPPTAEAPSLPIWQRLPFQPHHFAELIGYHVGRRPWLLIPVGLAAAVCCGAAFALWKRRGWQAVALCIVAPLAYLGPMSLAWPFRDDIIRFSMPFYPYLLIIAAGLACWALNCAGPLQTSPEEDTLT